MIRKSVARYVRAVLLAGALLFLYGSLARNDAFYHFGFRVMKPGFADLRLLFASAECAELGQDVYHRNTCDEWHRVYTYSPVWLSFMRSLHLTRENTNPVGIVLVTFFTIGCSLVLRPRSIFELLVAGLVMASPAVVLGVERCNLDLPITVGLAVAAIGVSMKSPLNWILLVVGIGPGAAAKYFPVLSLPGLLAIQRTWRERLILSGTVIAIVGGVLAVPGVLHKIIDATPNPGWYNIVFGAMNGFRAVGLYAQASRYAFYAVPVVALLGWLAGSQLQTGRIEPAAAAWLLVGVSVYCGVFFLNSSCEYRRVLLILTVPGLLQLLSDGPWSMKAVAGFTLLLLLTALWAILWGSGIPHSIREAGRGDFPLKMNVLKQAVDWTLVLFLTICAVPTRRFSLD